jgi:hypothetical protein
LDSGAYLYRFNIYTLDTPLALLTLLFLSPVHLHKAAEWNAQPRRDAQLAMLVLLTFVSTYYLLAGMAKFAFDPNWASVVRVGNYYPISYLWHGQIMPEPIDTFARVSSEVLRARPWLDTLSSAIVLIEQFVWVLAPISLVARIHAGLFAVAYHFVVMLSTGIVFLTWMPIALAVTLPFSTIARRLGWVASTAAASSQNLTFANRALLAAAITVAFLAAWLPSRGTVYPPFYNYHSFGWRYPAFAEMKPFYRIGFRNPKDNKITAIPLHHGAFLDFIQAGYLDTSSRLLVEQRGNLAIETAYKTNVLSLLLALRPREANGWLLGRWRAPNHLLSEPGDIDVYKIRQFKILKGYPLPSVNGRPAQVRWQVCGEIDLDHPIVERRVITHEVCNDAT